MQIKKLIKQLEAIYSTYDDEYKSVMGEPEIMLDVFALAKDYPGYPKLNPCRFLREYAGWTPDIIIEKSTDGVYDVISSFAESYEELKNQANSAQSTQYRDRTASWPQSWQA